MISAQRQRSWSTLARVFADRKTDMPLLRTWDHFSGSQPDEETGDMLARAYDLPLRTVEARKSSLATHLVHREWKPTPFISFTSSWQKLQDLANFREQRPHRGDQTITVIDPSVRLEAGWPILCVGDEMRYYGIPEPYGMHRSEHDNHHVCLWSVKKEEIVGHWDWNELSRNPRWYEEIIYPEFERFREQRQQQHASNLVEDISAGIEALGLGGRTSSPSPPGQSSGSAGQEESHHGVDDEIDTDDEVDETHATDDTVKALESA
ncbi:hypothetical protein FALBO_4213 [Fusarium albosuccineum]|uniref:DUF7587 domain-containing protein n=1 Tax=Fusarium albosuccineum TaxID=1237068 RepID=A0A8H4LIU0_9HYPO|nr:hypothetical protein FALBO_4213 [Fusarium albosuccineum]